MSVVRLVLGACFIALGVVQVTARDRFVAPRRRARERATLPPTAYAVMGVIMGVNGAVQVALALV